MAAGTTALTKTLDRIIAQAKTIGGIGNTRVFQGYKRWTDTQDFHELVRALTAESQGFFWARIVGVESEGSLNRRIWVFEGELALYVPKDTSTDLNTAWDLAFNLAAALEDESAYGDGEFAPQVSYRSGGVNALEKGDMQVIGFGHNGLGSMRVIDP